MSRRKRVVIGKILSLLTLFSCVLPLLFSCSNDFPLDEEAFREEAAETLRRAAIVNTIWFSKTGIPVKEDGKQSGNYKEIDNNALQNYGFSSLAEVEEETRMLFDTDTAAYILDMMQNPFHYGEIARRYIKVEEKTFAYIGEREYLSDDITFCTETLQILSHQKENGIPTVKVSCDVEVQNEDKSVQRRTGETFRFRKENGRWQLSELVSFTYDTNY